MRLIKCPCAPLPSSLAQLKKSDTPVDLIVTPRSCSSARVSVKRASPAAFAEMIPAFEIRQSDKVDLPWSTCAMMDKHLIWSALSMHARSSSTVKFGMDEDTRYL